jgi:hypothetical protein
MLSLLLSPFIYAQTQKGMHTHTQQKKTQISKLLFYKHPFTGERLQRSTLLEGEHYKV